MLTFYIIFIVLCFVIEITAMVNTDNLLKKIGLGLMIVGALIRIYFLDYAISQANHLIPIGAFVYLLGSFMNYYRPLHPVIKQKITKLVRKNSL